MSAVLWPLLALLAQLPICATSALTQSVTPTTFDNVKPGTTQDVTVLIENHNPPGCPVASAVVSATSASPILWVTKFDGGTKWTVASGGTVSTRLHIGVPREATTGSVVVNYSLTQAGVDAFVVPIVVNVQR